MKTFAYIINGVVQDVTTEDPNAIFFPDVANLYDTVVPNGTIHGATIINGEWTNPVQPEPNPIQIIYQDLSAMQLYLAFKPRERIAIKGSNDPMTQEFWATYELAVQTNSTINPNLSSFQSALTHLVLLNIITTDRIEAISNGVAQ